MNKFVNIFIYVLIICAMLMSACVFRQDGPQRSRRIADGAAGTSEPVALSAETVDAAVLSSEAVDATALSADATTASVAGVSVTESSVATASVAGASVTESSATDAPVPGVAGFIEFTVTCESVLQNMDKLNPDKRELIPEDGIIFYSDEVKREEGDSVFDVLLREMKREKIHLEYTGVPALKSVYVEGVNNLYEFDCGESSGWIYTVNGVSPGFSCSMYEIKPGDSVVFAYTCEAYPEISGLN